MPRLTQVVPKYRKHRATGQAIVTLAGQDRYLGKYGTNASRMLYDRLIAEYLASNRNPTPHVEEVGVTVVEVLAAFWKHAKGYYTKNGKPTTEQKAFKVIIKDVRQLYGDVPAEEFGPKALKAVRQIWIGRRHKRSTVNSNVRKLIRIFRWASAEEMIPPVVHEALRTVPGLRKGRSAAGESAPVKPVDLKIVQKTIEHLLPIVRDMIRVQLLTGMRPGEVCNLRPCDIVQSDEVWEYSPGTHKTEHHQRERTIYLGPEAQSVLRPYLERETHQFCFSPKENVAAWLDAKNSKRQTPLSSGNGRGKNLQIKPQRSPSDHYTSHSYRRAIHRACDRALPPPDHLAQLDGETLKQWHQRLGTAVAQLKQWQSAHRWSPNQLRHTAATNIRKKYGLEAAQVILGHAALTATQIYAERDAERAREVARQIG